MINISLKDDTILMACDECTREAVNAWLNACSNIMSQEYEKTSHDVMAFGSGFMRDGKHVPIQDVSEGV